MTEDLHVVDGDFPPDPPPPSVSVPVLPTEIDVVVVPVNEEEDVCGIMLQTILVPGIIFHLSRSQVIELGAKLLKTGEKMRKRPNDARVTAVRKRLILPQ